MNRFHIHLSVQDLDANIRFYSAVFGMEPSVRKDDYAKWMVEDPRINFAISTRQSATGVNHLGIQVDSDEALATLRNRAADAALGVRDEKGAECCYALSDKYWLTDPQGIPWETYHTLDSIPLFGGSEAAKSCEACCAPPTAVKVAMPKPAAARSKCCD
jgi:catechol 2,3-dioxygenase-like lactoylglutathione lyase family enzyme